MVTEGPMQSNREGKERMMADGEEGGREGG